MAGVAAQAGRGHDPAPDGELVDPVAHRRDPTGHLTARSKGERGFYLVLAGDEKAVDEVDAGCFDLDHDL